jgi:hypothetical protein
MALTSASIDALGFALLKESTTQKFDDYVQGSAIHESTIRKCSP